ncbi:ABC transporter substrate-binding protein [Streptomyces zhihengii]|uniref:ABC transporter substrate-binding protein n=1 Tax=Streptomyces zhihengii TaxID=1818004 RepID=UPI0033AE555D
MAAAIGVMMPLLGACSFGPDSDDPAIVVGTTDAFVSSEASPYPFDPAAAYDVGNWNVLRNAFHTLLRTPRGGSGAPVPDAASRCGYTDRMAQRFRCELRDGLTFSDGTPLGPKEVKYSIERVRDIEYQDGPYALLSNIDRIETDGSEIIFHLEKPDATFPYKLSTPAASIVNPKYYPKDKLRGGYEIDGSGPYVMEATVHDGVATALHFARNESYRGSAHHQNGRVELRSFENSEKMMSALKAGKIDVMSRTISPDQIDELRSGDSVKLVDVPGLEIRYLGFNTDAPVVRKKKVRQAIAHVIDRGDLAKKVYPQSADLLYSMIPATVVGHVNSFFNKYGEPDLGRAEELLQEAGVETPVSLNLYYTTDHYGAATKKEFEVIRSQLNASGLFDVQVKGAEWSEFRPALSDRKYPVYGMGWFPDFPDPDSFVAPFLDEGNFINTPYVNQTIRGELIPRTRKVADRSAAVIDYKEIQDIIADEVPFIPLWTAHQYTAMRDEIAGAEWAVNGAAELQLWEFRRA